MSDEKKEITESYVLELIDLIECMIEDIAAVSETEPKVKEYFDLIMGAMISASTTLMINQGLNEPTHKLAKLFALNQIHEIFNKLIFKEYLSISVNAVNLDTPKKDEPPKGDLN